MINGKVRDSACPIPEGRSKATAGKRPAAEQFDPVAFRILVERLTVYEGKRVLVRFNDGSEIEA